MTKAVAIAKHQPLAMGEAVARSRELMRLWNADLEATPPEELRELCLIGAEAMRDRTLDGVPAALLTPASAREIALAVNNLVKVFAAMRKDADLGPGSKIMAEEIEAIGPSQAALETAMRGLATGCTFPPTIKEVLDAVKEQHEAMQARAVLLERLPARILEIRSKIGDPT